MFEAICGERSDWRVLDTEREAIAYAERFESGEVRRIADDAQVWAKWPQPVWA